MVGVVRFAPVKVCNGAHLQMLVSARMAGDAVGLLVQKKREEAPVSMTVLLADLPGSADVENAPLELPAGFPVPEEKK